jgi:signal peptidase II
MALDISLTLQHRFRNVSGESGDIYSVGLGETIYGMPMSKAEKWKAALAITFIAGASWGIDALTKHIAIINLSDKPNHAAIGIKNFLYFVLGTNYGGSNGIVAPEFVELCLALPAVVMFLAALWVGRQLRQGRPITLLQQLGLGLLLGGSLGNWSERVIHHGVTDFIYLSPVGFCIFNLADITIDSGNLCLILAFTLQLLKQKGNLAAENSSAKIL